MQLSGDPIKETRKPRYIQRSKVARMILKIRNLTTRDLLELILDKAIGSRSNEMVIEKPQRIMFAKVLASALDTSGPDEPPNVEPLSDRAILRSLAQLVEHGHLHKYGKGKYRLNPSYYFIGSESAKVRAIDDFIEEKIAKRAEEREAA